MSEDIFNRSLISALVEIHQNMVLYGDDFDRDLFLKTKDNLGDYNFPYSQALEVEKEVGKTLFIDTTKQLEDIKKIILMNLIFHYEPNWFSLKNFQGRDQVLKNIENEETSIGNDIVQIFKDAELLDENNFETDLWWSILQSNLYSVNITELINGIIGENLSMEYERKKLISLEMSEFEPKKISVKNSTAGYDIESWEKGEDGVPRKIYIEVKYSERKHCRFFLTRNEYDTAERLKDDYLLHYWQKDKINNLDLRPTEEITFDWLKENVPIDNGKNSFWQTMLIDKSIKNVDNL